MYYICSYLAKLLADQWKPCISARTTVPVRVFRIPSGSTSFGEYYDHIQEGLRTLAGMDELMAGKYNVLVHVYHI